MSDGNGESAVVVMEREAITFTLRDSVHRFELSNALAEGDWQAAIEWATLFKLCEMTELQRQLIVMVARQREDASNAAQNVDIGDLMAKAMKAAQGIMPTAPPTSHTTPGGVEARKEG